MSKVQAEITIIVISGPRKPVYVTWGSKLVNWRGYGWTCTNDPIANNTPQKETPLGYLTRFMHTIRNE